MTEFKLGDKVVSSELGYRGAVFEVVRNTGYERAGEVRVQVYQKNNTKLYPGEDYYAEKKTLTLFENVLPREIALSEVRKDDKIKVVNKVKEDFEQESTLTVNGIRGRELGTRSGAWIYVSDQNVITLLERAPDPLVAPDYGSKWKNADDTVRYVFTMHMEYYPYWWAFGSAGANELVFRDSADEKEIRSLIPLKGDAINARSK